MTKIQLKNDANTETLQPTKQNDMVANNNTLFFYKHTGKLG